MLPALLTACSAVDLLNATVPTDTYRRSEGLAYGPELRQRLDALTAREKEVLRGVVDGKGSKQIASDLSISVKTVDVHRASIKEKLGATSIAALVRDVMVVWGDDGESSR